MVCAQKELRLFVVCFFFPYESLLFFLDEGISDSFQVSCPVPVEENKILIFVLCLCVLICYVLTFRITRCGWLVMNILYKAAFRPHNFKWFDIFEYKCTHSNTLFSAISSSILDCCCSESCTLVKAPSDCKVNTFRPVAAIFCSRSLSSGKSLSKRLTHCFGKYVLLHLQQLDELLVLGTFLQQTSVLLLQSTVQKT